MKVYPVLQVIAAIILVTAGCNRTKSQELEQAKTGGSFELNYDELIVLDAEYLAEGGIGASYEKYILPVLQQYVDTPAEIVEKIDSEAGIYEVTSQGKAYLISTPETALGENWGNATIALFDLVNRQLQDSEVLFYAINGGNDLGGMFLSREIYNLAINSYGQKQDWPYIPGPEAP